MLYLYNNYKNMKSITPIFLALMLIITSCTKKKSENPTPSVKQILLVYMVADKNGLDLEAVEKVSALTKIAEFSKEYRLFVFSDTNFKDTGRLLEVLPDGTGDIFEGKAKLLKEFGEVDNADLKSFSNVLNHVTDTYLADSYGLLVFSHASGWLPAGTPDTPSSARSTRQLERQTIVIPNDIQATVFIDKDKEMKLSDFADALPAHKFNYIIFEACNMAGIEVAYVLRNKVEYVVASSAQMVSPGFTPIYSQLIGHLFKNTPQLNEFTKTYINYYSNTKDRPYATLSVLKTSKIENLKNIVKEINTSGVNQIDRKSIQQFDGETTRPIYFFDFLDYYKKATTSTNYEKIKYAVEKVVIYKEETSKYYALPEKKSFDINTNSGITTYILGENEILDKEYKNLEWYKNVH